MAIARLQIQDAQGFTRSNLPGDLIAGGENILGAVVAATAGTTLTGANIANGIIRRTSTVGAGFTDTTDTAANIIAAIRGNANTPDIVPGTSFRLILQNAVAEILTLAAGTGVTLGTGTTSIAASSVREYIVTVLNAMTPVVLAATTVSSSSKTLNFNLQPTQPALPIGPGSAAGQINNGATVTGTGIAASTTVAGLIYGQGGITGVTLSQNASSGPTITSVTFGPAVQIDGLRVSSL